VNSADLVVTGAHVYTPARDGPPADTVAIRGGRIAAVGTFSDVGGLIGPATRVFRPAGGMVVPGFQDSHIHPDGGGLDLRRCALYDLRGRSAYEAAIRTYVTAHPEVPWVLGGGWSLDDFPRGCPHRSILDAIVPDRPVFLENRDGHGAWVNTRALELAGIGLGMPDPPDGRIEREEDGTPFGVLHEGAMALVSALVPPPTPTEVEQGLRDAQRYLHSLGVTAWQDAHVSPETLAAYRALEERGELTARVVGALWWKRDEGEEQIDDLIELRAMAPKGRFRATSVKIMQDGIIENLTAGMIEPYLGIDGRRGLSFVDPEPLKRAVTRLDAEGFQVHIHAIGDRAVREALDAFEAAREANGPNDHRHHIAHLQVVNPEDVPRFAALDVTPNCQPYWACLEGQMLNLCVPFLGDERTGHQYPFASLLKSGGRLAFGSDWPVTTPDPLKIMQVAITRVPDGETGDPFLPDERLDLSQALDAASMGTAYLNHLDHATGSIEEGKLANLVVLDRNPFDIDPMDIGDVKVVHTLVEGFSVHNANEVESKA
jgi:predicted amidohydrolase YtcJ